MSIEWKAGAAAVDITPTEPMWLAGWAARREPGQASTMPLFAKALALEDSHGNRVVIVTADLIALPRALTDAVAARAQLPRERVLFNASHTHTGPELRPDKVPFFEIPAEFAAKIARYVAWLETRLAGVIDAAIANLAPATLHAHTARATFAANRRSADGPKDHDVPVLVAEGVDGRPLAIVFGYACHNLTLPPTFCAYHGDYAGIAQAQLHRQFPGAITLFLSGAGADQDPAPRGTMELCATHGHALAEALGPVVAAEGRAIAGGLQVGWEDVMLDLQPLPAREKLQADAQSADAPLRRKAEFLLSAGVAGSRLATTQACPVQVLNFGGDLLLIAIGGEPVIEFALACKREFAGPLVWVAGYSNDMFGYVPTRRVQQEGGYEGGRAALWSAVPMPVADSTEERVMMAVRRIVSTLRVGKA